MGYTTVYYYSQAEVHKKNYESLLGDLEGLTMTVNLKIDYGNGTVVWHNNTRVPMNATLLSATKIVAQIDYSESEFGAFINKINGVGEDPNRFWLWNYKDPDTGEWIFGPVGCDQWVLHDGDTESWIYSAF